MAIYLRHKEHGVHICYDEADADLHVKERGWVRFDPKAEKDQAEKAQVKRAKPAEETAPAKPRAKPGPKPKAAPAAESPPSWLGGE